MSIADEALYIPAAGSPFVEGRSFAWNLVSTRSTQFGYFDDLLGHPEWKGRKILDFGGNVGTFLVGAGSRVDHDDYWCLDLNRDVVEQGRRTYPRAHFVHYNRYSSQYNPNGVRYLDPEEVTNTDAYAVAIRRYEEVARNAPNEEARAAERTAVALRRRLHEIRYATHH